MSVLYVARSASFSQWASDVGVSKHVYKLGLTAEPVKAWIWNSPSGGKAVTATLPMTGPSLEFD